MRDQRSLLNFAILMIVATTTAVFVLKKANEAIVEIEALSNTPTYAARRERTAVPDISAWKTYRNEKYGFEVKYPPDWSLIVDTTDTVRFKSSGVGEIDVFPNGYHVGDLDVSSCVSKKLNIGGRNIKQEDCNFGSDIRFDPPPLHLPYFVISFNLKKIGGDLAALNFEKFTSTFKFIK